MKIVPNKIVKKPVARKKAPTKNMKEAIEAPAIKVNAVKSPSPKGKQKASVISVKAKVTKTPQVKKISKKMVDDAMNHCVKHDAEEKMQHKNFYNQENFKMLDKDAMMNHHKKAMETISDANKMAVEIVKSLSSLQTQFMRQSFEDFTSMMKEMSATPMSPDSWKNQAKHMKDSLSKAVDHSSNMSNVMIRSNNDLYNKFQNHFSEVFEDMKYNVVSKKKH